MPIKICPKCETLSDSENPFCTNCGENLSNIEISNEQNIIENSSKNLQHQYLHSEPLEDKIHKYDNKISIITIIIGFITYGVCMLSFSTLYGIFLNNNNIDIGTFYGLTLASSAFISGIIMGLSGCKDTEDAKVQANCFNLTFIGLFVMSLGFGYTNAKAVEKVFMIILNNINNLFNSFNSLSGSTNSIPTTGSSDLSNIIRNKILIFSIEGIIFIILTLLLVILGAILGVSIKNSVRE